MSLLQKTWCRRTVRILSEKHIIDKSVLVVDLLTIPNLQKTLKFIVAQNFCGTFTATTNVGLYRERHLNCSANIQRNAGREEETGARTEACWVLQLVPHCSTAFSKAILFGGWTTESTWFFRQSMPLSDGWWYRIWLVKSLWLFYGIFIVYI
jgi:hypothetical protein